MHSSGLLQMPQTLCDVFILPNDPLFSFFRCILITKEDRIQKVKYEQFTTDFKSTEVLHL